MKELRSIVNAVFLFALFLFVYAFVAPGRARGSANPPRFLRMEVEDLSGFHGRGAPKRVGITVPYGIVGGVLRFAALGRVRRELDLHFEDPVASEVIASVWEELKKKPEGEEILRTHGDAELRFKKEGSLVRLQVSKLGRHDDAEKVTLRIPAHFFEAIVERDGDLDVDTLLSQLRSARHGDLVDVEARDAHVRIWIE
jgi:hypothetical protein